jgi:hypothetical protein
MTRHLDMALLIAAFLACLALIGLGAWQAPAGWMP